MENNIAKLLPVDRHVLSTPWSGSREDFSSHDMFWICMRWVLATACQVFIVTDMCQRAPGSISPNSNVSATAIAPTSSWEPAVYSILTMTLNFTSESAIDDCASSNETTATTCMSWTGTNSNPGWNISQPGTFSNSNTTGPVIPTTYTSVMPGSGGGEHLLRTGLFFPHEHESNGLFHKSNCWDVHCGI